MAKSIWSDGVQNQSQIPGRDSLGALGPPLCDDQAGLNRLSQANLVGQNATAFAEVTKCENYGVNLVRIWINTRLGLRGGITLALIRPAYTDQVFGESAG